MNLGRSIPVRFSTASRTYEERAAVQSAVARRLVSMIGGPERAGAPRRILEAGCGTGVLTRMLRARFPEADIVALDLAVGMAAQAEREFRSDARVRIVAADAASFACRCRFPIIASNCALHWVAPFARAIENLARLLADGGRLLASVMVQGTLEELHDARRRAAPRKPPAGRLPTEAEALRAVAAAGLSLQAQETEVIVVRHASAWEFLQTIHQQGLTGGPVSSAGHPLTRGELARLASDYESRYGGPGGVRASYRVLYIGAGRPA